MPRISSRQNSIVAKYKNAAAGDDHSLMLLDGVHLVGEALSAKVPVTHVLVAAEFADRDDIRPLVESAARAGADVATATAPVMRAVSPVRSASPIVALAGRPHPGEASLYGRNPALVLIACGVQDPGNLGAIARAVEAAGGSGLVATNGCADPFGWKALRGSMGSALRLPVDRVDDAESAVAEARARGCYIVATVPRDGRSHYEARLTGKLAVLIGGEGPGLPQSLIAAADERVTIPMEDGVESINAATTAAVIVYEARRQRANEKR